MQSNKNAEVNTDDSSISNQVYQVQNKEEKRNDKNEFTPYDRQQGRLQQLE